VSELRWTKVAISARVDQLAGEHQGDAFIVAVKQFSEQLTAKERNMLQDVLMAKANLRSRIADAAQERRTSGWLRRLLAGELRSSRSGPR
jgi:RNA processing factor Prp31